MIVNCLRCHVRCQTGAPAPEAMVLRESADQGYCVNCAVTEFFQTRALGGVSLEETLLGSNIFPGYPNFTPKVLLEPCTQAAFAEFLRNCHAQVDPKDIDWLEVVANWHLPFPKKWGGRKARR